MQRSYANTMPFKKKDKKTACYYAPSSLRAGSLFFCFLISSGYERAWPGPQEIFPEHNICCTDTDLTKIDTITMLGR